MPQLLVDKDYHSQARFLFEIKSESFHSHTHSLRLETNADDFLVSWSPGIRFLEGDRAHMMIWTNGNLHLDLGS
jgi:hypothetical protein